MIAIDIRPHFLSSSKLSSILPNLKMATLAFTIALTGCATQHASQNYERPIYVNGVPNIYVVQSGDTLSHIATRYHLNYRKIAALNGLDSNYTIYTGQRLRLFSTNGSTGSAQPNRPARPPTLSIQTTPTYNYPVNDAPVYSPPSVTTPVVTTPVMTTQNWLAPVNGSISRGFGNGSNGIWYSSQAGAPVVASQAGTVLYSGNQLTEYGNLIMIRHDSDYVTAYAHLGQMNVKEGQQVQAGETIATVGMTDGKPLTEFQIRYRGTPVNPAVHIK